MIILFLFLLINYPSIREELAIPPSVAIYAQPADTSSVIYWTKDTVVVKVIFEVVQGSEEWYYVKLPSGEKGFIPKVENFKSPNQQMKAKYASSESNEAEDKLPKELEEACLKAQMDARADIEGEIWFGAGFLFGILGVGAAYLIEPTPPLRRLIGKSPEYVAYYTDCYKEAAREYQTDNAMIGCLGGILAYIFLRLIVLGYV